jgi:hypothetical protein
MNDKSLLLTGIFSLFRLKAAVFIGLLSFCATTFAGEADVIKATIKKNADGSYRVEATIKSKDRGWAYFADKFDVVTRDRRVLGTRVLAHPHDDEQPFTRELDGVKIPTEVKEVIVRAHMKGRMKNSEPREPHPDQTITLAVPTAP